MQFPVAAKPPVGVVFDSAMDRIDDVLALAMLHGFEGHDQARIAAVSVSSGDFRAAQFCDVMARFYASATTGPAAMFRHFAPIGLADGQPAAEPAMFSKPFDGASIKSLNDTADPATLIRNSLMAQHDQNAVVVLSGAATDLAKLLDMYGVKDWISRKVKLLCVAQSADEADDVATRKVFAGWPTPIVTVEQGIGEALPFPADSIDKDFAWSSGQHPVVDAYRAWQRGGHDAPTPAMAAMLYAVHPNDGYFKPSEGGQPRTLTFDPEQKDRIIRTYIEMASAKPVARKPKRPPDDRKDEKKDEKKEAAK